MMILKGNNESSTLSSTYTPFVLRLENGCYRGNYSWVIFSLTKAVKKNKKRAVIEPWSRGSADISELIGFKCWSLVLYWSLKLFNVLYKPNASRKRHYIRWLFAFIVCASMKFQNGRNIWRRILIHVRKLPSYPLFTANCFSNDYDRAMGENVYTIDISGFFGYLLFFLAIRELCKSKNGLKPPRFFYDLLAHVIDAVGKRRLHAAETSASKRNLLWFSLSLFLSFSRSVRLRFSAAQSF